MLVGVYLDPRQSSTTSKSAESGNYEVFVVILYCQLGFTIKLNNALLGEETKLKLEHSGGGVLDK